MGGSCSSLQDVGNNDYLRRFCSSEVICENDPFWNALLSFSLVDLDLVAMDSSNAKLLDDISGTYCKNLAINNIKTGNFHTLVMYFVHRLDKVIQIGVSEDTTNPFTWQVLNALFLVRIVTKHFVQNLSEEVIIQQFLKPLPLQPSSEGTTDDQRSSEELFMSGFLVALTKGLSELPVHETTVLLHLEMINCLLTLLAMALFDTSSTVNNSFYIELMQGESSHHAKRLTQVLLTMFSYSDKIPNYVYREDDSASSLSSTLWSVMTLGMAGGSSHHVKKVDLGTQGVLLLLVLTIHPSQDNPYKQALVHLNSEKDELSFVKPEVLYATLCSSVESEYGTLMLYKLLHESPVTKAFILSRTDIEKLAEPLLRALYQQEGVDDSHHPYLTLIVLLMLTEDDSFNKDLFLTKLLSVNWYKDKRLAEVTLGDVFILVIIKVMQFNMSHTKDQYLQTNCLATLANASSKFTHLDAYVCQRLVTFYSMLVKRHGKTVARLQIVQLKASNEDDESSEGECLADQLTQDVCAIEDMLRMVLEILNSCITHTVHLNTNLVHVLLCHRDEFEKFKHQESFKHILQNILTLLDQFHHRLVEVFGEQPRSVSEVLTVIEERLKTFRRGTFLKFPDLKFKYIEETDPSRFFVPYVWQIVCRHSHLHFKPSSCPGTSLT